MAKTKRTNEPKLDQPATEPDDVTLESEFAVADRKITVRRDGGKVVVSVPVRFYRRNGRQMILADDYTAESKPHESLPPNTALVVNLARAWFWQEQLESGQFGCVEEIATANDVDRTYVSRILQLTSLSPSIVEKIMEGNEPAGLSLRKLRKGIPLVWEKQF
ncbi:hypothetical protein VN12_08220 [Pirellula sp. SH-Sr6A]|uniref:hypothetical protein n=1 Tax=Pirellula sp. SH-Sr6A TaxID=1632865 RepID=UPI00078D8925|nr:hypothetical protein [Pirellula sp. SH-Sr6A]AMV32094.1 hypothetical protein VN12_08220 [Pirellula sp. SH-Sr6A]